MIKAVVLDVGETLIDETRIWQRWSDRLGVPRLAFMAVFGAMIATERFHRDAFQIVRPGFDVEADIKAWAAEEPDSLRNNFDGDDLYPDARPALAELKRRGRTVVIAGNQPVQAKAALERMELPADAIFTSAGWGVEKPDQGFFLKVAEVAGAAPAQICYVGDRLDNDVLAAGKAGMRTAFIRRGPWGYLHAQLPEVAKADLVIESLLELPDRLTSLDA